MPPKPFESYVDHPTYGPIVKFGLAYEKQHRAPCFEYLNELLHFLMRFRLWDQESHMNAAMKGLRQEDLEFVASHVKALKYVVSRLLGQFHRRRNVRILH